MLDAACEAGVIEPSRARQFLQRYADRIEARADELVDLAHQETQLPKSPRLKDVELPRTTSQLRQAALAATDRSWALPTIDRRLNIRSIHAPIGPVVVFGPNNFPFAFNAVSGGDFAAAIAVGNPVIARAHPDHPRTCSALASIAIECARECGLPRGAVQFVESCSADDGLRLVSDPRVGATAFTGSRRSGLALKEAADRAGKPIYLEMSSVNPVVITPGPLRDRGDRIADEFVTSSLMGCGQFCTNPGLVVLQDDPSTKLFIDAVADRLRAATCGEMLSRSVVDHLEAAVRTLVEAGAQVVTGGKRVNDTSFENSLLLASARQFMCNPQVFQTEAFGNACLVVVCSGSDEVVAVLQMLDGNLTGTIYADDASYEKIEKALRGKVGRLLNDKMPTGVAVSPAMQHGGPFPATGHPGFTAVGIPASLRRFTKLECYDNVPEHRLPPALRAAPVVRVIDSHTAGEPTRVVISGGPDLGAGSIADRLKVFRDKHDDFRRAIVTEPRGSDVLVGALLCEPVDKSCAAGVIFFNNVGYLGMCGHGMIGVAVTLVHLGRIGAGRHMVETPVGQVTVNLLDSNTVAIDNVESYRHLKDVTVNVEGVGPVTGDVAWGGNWFFLVSEPRRDLSLAGADLLVDLTWRIRQALERAGVTGRDGAVIDHVELFGPPTDPSIADSRNFVLCPGKAFDRSPCGTGTSAKLACLVADGKLKPGQVYRQQSITGTVFEGTVRLVDGRVLPTIRGQAFVTGETNLLFDPNDPFRGGL